MKGDKSEAAVSHSLLDLPPRLLWGEQGKAADVNSMRVG
jgi:hypothetical protein